ncbi:MAG: class I SAM-dependent methyltransferase [Verrucomicrobiae bacterium]|nr:class I SAM-dependent methyltransferase [Verrucomicrobiae bacterium]
MRERRQHNRFTYGLELLAIRLRDLFRSPAKVLLNAGIQESMSVLDFGCGPGGFALAAARIVGPKGRVYAVDIQPAALDFVRRAAVRQKAGHLLPLHRNRIGEVPEHSVDVALLYDVIHIYPDTHSMSDILAAIHRVLKPRATLSVSDHHLQASSILSKIERDFFFRFINRNRQTFQFMRMEPPKVAK